MKKKIIIIIISLIALAGIVWLVFYLFSFKNISFKLNQDVTSAVLYKDGQKIETLDSDKTIRLQVGDYKLTPSGKKISLSDISLTVTKDEEIAINPDYSTDYLSSILEAEKAPIGIVLNNKYPGLAENYFIANYKLFKKGEWFSGLLINKLSEFDSKKDSFRFVAYKENDEWQIINYPDLILTKQNYTDVPESILNYINSQIYNL